MVILFFFSKTLQSIHTTSNIKNRWTTTVGRYRLSHKQHTLKAMANQCNNSRRTPELSKNTKQNVTVSGTKVNRKILTDKKMGSMLALSNVNFLTFIWCFN